ncbi:cholesterol dehydrogenase [Fusarium langsethiae]|uniref:Cholesterol dehydrogenase n=1 Tax=Fusarium langsethiae TaxID=179993 RepID=A0A0M9ENY6_FUSLA|nr:cholesterol dehydrogenase [Fusarium langsethiae]GKU07910.1 unnamed protein product [Fusarium langsethiae]GKU08927.1 unnamed protein product [Fusarium langsethiae]
MTLIVTHLLGITSFGLLAAIRYLGHVNHILKQTPQEVCQLSSKPWAPARLSETYAAIEKSPIDLYKSLPTRLNRRYIITGGNGLVGGYVVLQLLARGTPPKSIRIVDIRETERDDMRIGLAAKVDFLQTDITSITSTERSFNKPWDSSVKDLPLTVFHTAAVIVPSARSKHLYEFLQAVNVQGTKNVLAASRAVGATVFSSTSSASICVWPVDPFVSPWATEPRNYWQVLDVRDFSEPLRRHEDYFGNYSASKAAAERLRMGYMDIRQTILLVFYFLKAFTTRLPHIVQNFVHGANVAIAHLHHEAVLATGDCQQAGKPFVVTDPGPLITFGDLYMAVKTLSIHRFRTALVPPVMMLLLSVVVEWYILLPYRFLALGRLLPELKGDIRKLQPAIFSICTHLIASDPEARRPVNEGGIGYEGIVTTFEVVVMEIVDWNSEHLKDPDERRRKRYTSSVSLVEKLQAFGSVARL